MCRYWNLRAQAEARRRRREEGHAQLRFRRRGRPERAGDGWQTAEVLGEGLRQSGVRRPRAPWGHIHQRACVGRGMRTSGRTWPSTSWRARRRRPPSWTPRAAAPVGSRRFPRRGAPLAAKSCDACHAPAAREVDVIRTTPQRRPVLSARRTRRRRMATTARRCASSSGATRRCLWRKSFLRTRTGDSAGDQGRPAQIRRWPRGGRVPEARGHGWCARARAREGVDVPRPTLGGAAAAAERIQRATPGPCAEAVLRRG